VETYKAEKNKLNKTTVVLQEVKCIAFTALSTSIYLIYYETIYIGTVKWNIKGDHTATKILYVF